MTLTDISIHALRVEGDQVIVVEAPRIKPFLSTPSGWRATAKNGTLFYLHSISIHALRVEGDAYRRLRKVKQYDFYPRPPGGGRHFGPIGVGVGENFYPRPPGGGRRLRRSIRLPPVEFLSTPSGWRATMRPRTQTTRSKFLSTPSGWRATVDANNAQLEFTFLSTPSGWRATRTSLWTKCKTRQFLSTPSGWRATEEREAYEALVHISIHALRVEGDSDTSRAFLMRYHFYPRPPGGGRQTARGGRRSIPYFYPRPPGGGRR